MTCKRIITSIFLVAALIYGSLFFGCANNDRTYSKQISTPLSDNAELAEWREIAAEIADRVEKAINDRADLYEKPITVVQPSADDFANTFYQLLCTELTSRGLQVSLKRERGGLDLLYTVKVVDMTSEESSTLVVTETVSENFNKIEPEVTYFGFGTIRTKSPSPESGITLTSKATVSETPIYVVVSSDLNYDNRYVMHSSSSYQIFGSSLGLYGEKQKVNQEVTINSSAVQTSESDNAIVLSDDPSVNGLIGREPAFKR